MDMRRCPFDMPQELSDCHGNLPFLLKSSSTKAKSRSAAQITSIASSRI